MPHFYIWTVCMLWCTYYAMLTECVEHLICICVQCNVCLYFVCHVKQCCVVLCSKADPEGHGTITSRLVKSVFCHFLRKILLVLSRAMLWAVLILHDVPENCICLWVSSTLSSCTINYNVKGAILPKLCWKHGQITNQPTWSEHLRTSLACPSLPHFSLSVSSV